MIYNHRSHGFISLCSSVISSDVIFFVPTLMNDRQGVPLIFITCIMWQRNKTIHFTSQNLVEQMCHQELRQDFVSL